MAFEMVNKNVKLLVLKDDSHYLGIIIDFSSNVDKAIVSFNLLLSGKINSLVLKDEESKNCITLKNSGTEDYCYDETIIGLSSATISIIIDMLLDVSVGNGFNGYHYDHEILKGVHADLAFNFQ